MRENGGQYTHAAVWATMAFAVRRDSARAWELLGMINPVNHARTAEAVAVYKNEPYVVSADVYALSPHVGAGRVVLVYRFSRLALSPDGRNPAWSDPGRP